MALNFDGTQEQGGLPGGKTSGKPGEQDTFTFTMEAFIGRQKASGSPADMLADKTFLVDAQIFLLGYNAWAAHYGQATVGLHQFRVWSKQGGPCGFTLETM